MMDLGRLLESLDQGGLALPDFQRDFDWLESDVLALLVTVLSGWPAGSLLLMRNGEHLFRLRPFEAGPPIKRPPQYVVLDGQQRLTSLYHALYDRGPRVYAVKIDDSGALELEEAVRSYPRHEWDANWGNPEAQLAERLVPFSALVTPTTFFEWRDGVVACARTDDSEAAKELLTKVYRSVLSTIHRYEFPGVILEEELEPAAIARIFERVNRTGMKLSTFDLMVAKVFEPDWNLRLKWDELRRERPMLASFLGDDGMPVLQTISLRYNDDVRQSSVLRLSKALVHDSWESTGAGIDAAAGFFRDHCGAPDLDSLPYASMIVPVAALAADFPLLDHRDTLLRWFWSRALAQAFDVAANTRIVSEYQDLESVLGGSRALDVPQVDFARLAIASRKTHRAVWAAFRCALTLQSPNGLFAEPEGDHSEALQLVSVLPRVADIEEGEGPSPHLRVFGLVTATPKIARAIQSRGLLAVAEEVARELGEEHVENELSLQLLPPLRELSEAMRIWERLLDRRVHRFESFIDEAVPGLVLKPG